ncbi:MAG: class F sortase [Chloroflexi bacterium]|nr:class F sortase [Chloroflexota bacterium]
MTTIDTLLGSLSPSDLLIVALGIGLGLGVVLLLRAQQTWRFRGDLGMSVYQANQARQRLSGWAFAASGIALLAGAGYLILALDSPDPIDQTKPIGRASAHEDVYESRLIIPELNINTHIVHAPIVDRQWDVSQVGFAVAHLEGTVFPGDYGNAVLAGHITVPDAGWGPFHELDQLEPGHLVFIRRGDERLWYEVTAVHTVGASAVDVTHQTDDYRLTLITCTGWDDAEERYLDRLIVSAQLISDPAP